MSTKVIMPSDRVRMSPGTYREYALSYGEIANLMRKTSEDTAKIVPIPVDVWSGEAPQRFTAMLTQVTGAASTVAASAKRSASALKSPLARTPTAGETLPDADFMK